MLRLLPRIRAIGQVSKSSMKRKYHAISSDTRVMPTTARIELNAREQQLKGLLLDVAAHINSASQKDEEVTVVRWAGGWVRDKLLGVESHDIDVAINSMTGEKFAHHLSDFCDQSEENRTKHGMRPEDVGSLHTVARNPDKSKHLETTTTRLFGLDVDFVNLRKETYADDSRNPQMEFGTAEEDALRRDATINALFYNIHTGEVEDFTGGLADMERRLIRTPLEPLQTFMDDPLRVLRLIRFASRLEFELDSRAAEVMSDRRVLDALRVKISRERVGIELEKMLKGKHPLESLKLIDRLRLYHTIFTDPARQDMPRPDLSKWNTAYDTLAFLADDGDSGSLYQTLVKDDEDKYIAWVLASLTPWELLPDDPPLKSGKAAVPLATQAAREGFKAPNKVCDVITVAHRNRSGILRLKKVVNLKQEDVGKRDVFGMAIRQWDARDGNWRLQVMSAILVDTLEAAASNVGPVREKILGEWREFLDHLAKLDVMEATSIKRLVDGKQLAKALGVKPGKWMSRALDIVMEWQLRNPEATDPAGAVDDVKQHKEELGLA